MEIICELQLELELEKKVWMFNLKILSCPQTKPPQSQFSCLAEVYLNTIEYHNLKNYSVKQVEKIELFWGRIKVRFSMSKNMLFSVSKYKCYGSILCLMAKRKKI